MCESNTVEERVAVRLLIPILYYMEFDVAFKPLEKYAILEHIDILKRVLEMREERKVA